MLYSLTVDDKAEIFKLIENQFQKLENLKINGDKNALKLFYQSYYLVGGNGTTYSSSHITAEYARVDGENGLPGYFTAPQP